MLSVAMFPFGCYSLCALLFYGFLTHTHINWPESPMVSKESIHKRWYLSLIVLSYNLRNTIISIVHRILSLPSKIRMNYIRIFTLYNKFCRIWTFPYSFISKQLQFVFMKIEERNISRFRDHCQRNYHKEITEHWNDFLQ